ncbi:Alanine racemase [Thioalkalivibrio nitratireducens DSM 14787]|uniref:Alanine racemase n=1 Tax=Thioalkalivibrio nitratireducens (strain DSM 14787 / UNIQEM 213 / ALEN2) TaxID=1255043 RepID=L0E0Y4_THIND|nr:alanine racemase [Thioalkalivibrio nitratireducens]AGA34892.1 Alanine racemase [Thioalkalivibrio nitratireducens DSM 14787]
MKRAAVIHRSPRALRHNLALARSLAPGRHVWTVIKADAYGHGMEWAAGVLEDVADGLSVSCLEEARALRDVGIGAPILVLQGPRSAAEWRLCASHDLQPVLHEEAQLPGLEALREPLPGLWIKLDTGMHRLGFVPLKAQSLYAQLHRHPAARNGLHWMTHLACADQPEHPQNAVQLEAFSHAVAELPGKRSFANSAAVVSGLASATKLGEWLRPGIMLYGASPLDGENGPERGLRPAMTVTAPLIALKSLEPGASVGYGATWTAERPTRAGVVAIGYADGYPRHAPSGTPVRVHGRECPLIGRVSMDMLEIDLTGVPEARVGDSVTLWGQGLPVARIARAAGTISYELLTRVAERLRVAES